MKFLKCDTCGNILQVIEDSDYIPICHDNKMRLLETSKLKDNKHLINFKVTPITDGVSRIKVFIGQDELHPMKSDHFIKFICVRTNKSIYTRFLKTNDRPCISFLFNEHEKLKEINAYCNIHGLSKINLDNK